MKIKLSLLKTITWYIFHFTMVTMIATFITHKTEMGLKLASAELLFETALYYSHEEIWNFIRSSKDFKWIDKRKTIRKKGK